MNTIIFLIMVKNYAICLNQQHLWWFTSIAARSSISLLGLVSSYVSNWPSNQFYFWCVVGLLNFITLFIGNSLSIYISSYFLYGHVLGGSCKCFYHQDTLLWKVQTYALRLFIHSIYLFYIFLLMFLHP